jgi:hypothetical protein
MNDHDEDPAIENGDDSISDDDLDKVAGAAPDDAETEEPFVDEAAEEEIASLDDAVDEPVVDEADDDQPGDEIEDGEQEDTGVDDEEEIEVADAEDVPNGVLLGDELDIEAALASVVSLSDALAEHAAAETEETERLEAEAEAIEQVNQVLREEAERRAAYSLPRPPMISTIQRGQGASVVPAILLMVIGAWLTFTLTTSDAPPPTGTVVMVVMGSLGLSMLAYWFTSRRWARGAFVSGMTLVLFTLVALYLTQSDELGADGWPLFVIAGAVAILLGAFVSPRVSEGHVLFGLALAIAGMVALAVTTERVNEDVLDFASTMAPAVLVVVLIILLLPRIPKRRG